jgi:signal transduction histidine kinase
MVTAAARDAFGEVRAAAAVSFVNGPRSTMARYDQGGTPFPRRLLRRALAAVGERGESLYLPRSGRCQARVAVAPLQLAGAFGCLVVEHDHDVEPTVEELARLEGVARASSFMMDDVRRMMHAEHRRLERVLHDTFATTLTNLLFAAGRLGAAEQSTNGTVVHAIQSQARLAIRQFREVLAVVNGRSSDQPNENLAALVAEFRAYGLALRVSTDLTVGDLPADVTTTLCQVVREALTNVMRHAGAHGVDLAVVRQSNTVSVRVTDDGIGILGPGRRSLWSGVGLRLMRERVRELGGSLTLRAPSGGGTRVTAQFPAG